MRALKRFLRRIFFGQRNKSNLEKHTERELKLAGMYDEDVDYGSGALASAVLELVQVFARQNHSGGSAMAVLSLFSKVAAYKPLVPLKGTEDEWGESFSEDGTRQNKRCSHVFLRKDGTAYDINGRVFKEPNGVCFTNHDSFVDITFPYIPKTEYVPAPVKAETEEI
jgi:hypothetical protein